MRAQCCICADLFENAANVRNIAAVPCGHTFHEECLMRWLESSSTCPSCRKQVKRNQIIKRLYFDINEDEVETGDPDQLINQICTLKAELCTRAAESRELASARDSASELLATCLASKEDISVQLKQEQLEKLLMKRQLASMEEENNLYKRELAQFVANQKKLKGLESLQLMLEGCEQDVCEMVNCYTDGGEGAVKQLSSMVVVVKREYQKALDDKKALRDQIRMLKTEATQMQIKMGKMKQGVKTMQLQLKKSNQDVFALEQENNNNRRKIAHLRCAVKHKKTEGSQSFIAAVNEDSPNVAYTPPSSRVSAENESKDVDSNPLTRQKCNSPDLFDDSMVEDIETDTCSENASQINVAPKSLKMVHISSAAEKFQAAKQAKIECEKNAAPSLPFSNFSIMQKKLTGLSNSRALALPKSRAYNGLGGSTKIEEPSDTPNRGYMKFPKRNLSKKRNPLAQKPLPNQPKLAECLPKISTHTKSSLSEQPPSVTLNKQLLCHVKKKQPFVDNLFRKPTKTSSSSITSSSSSSSTTSSSGHFTLRYADCIDLT